MRKLAAFLVVLYAFSISAQQSGSIGEKPVSVTEAAVAFDAAGVAALEAKLSTTALSGAPETPVTNIRMVVRNASSMSYAFVSGVVTFYDNAGVRCGEGMFKAEALAANESFETDTPGIRIRCTPLSWRVVATSLVPRVVPNPTQSPSVSRALSRLVISLDGEQHPIQLDKPMTLTVGEKQRTIVVREAP